MRLFRTDINTGRTFKRTGSNFPVGSRQRARAELAANKLAVLKDLTNTGVILPMAVALNNTLAPR